MSTPSANSLRPAGGRSEATIAIQTATRTDQFVLGVPVANKLYRGWLAAVMAIACSGSALAQLAEQTVELNPGWNSVFLEIDPVPELADDLFADRPEIEAVWKRADVLAMGLGRAGNIRWQTWVPASDPARFAINLRIIEGGAVYLIKSSGATTLSLVGRPSAKKTKYLRGFNVVGFHADRVAPPSFNAYLAPSLVHHNTRVFKLKTTPPRDGSLVEVTDLNVPVLPQTGYWVKANGAAEYDGPLSVDKGSLRGIDFAKSLLNHTLTLENLATAHDGVDVIVRYLWSSSPLAGTRASVAGITPPPVRWLEYGSGLASEQNPIFKYNELEPGGESAVWHLGRQGIRSARRSFELSVDRQGLAPAWLEPDGTGSQYEGLLEISNGAGFRRLLPITAQVMGNAFARRGVIPPGPPGLWVGMVTVREVQWVTAGARIWINDDPNDPSFEENRRCFEGWKDGQTCMLSEDPEDPDPCICPRDCIDGVCDVNTCDGGPNHGGLCTSHSDCACPCTPFVDDGTCEYYCVGGENEGGVCDSTADCVDGVCSAEATSDDDVETLRPTDSEFQFPVLVHIGADGASHMLTEVTVLWQPGTAAVWDFTDPDDPVMIEPEVPGAYVLATPACPGTCCDNLDASSIVSGEPFAQRLSTANFGFEGDLLLVQGQSAELQSTLGAVTVMPGHHPLNPFRHKYHPDHDEPEEQFTDENGNGRWDIGEPFVDANRNNTWDEGDSYRITRDFAMAFYNNQPDWLAGAGWGDQLLAGDYTETVIGLYKTDFDPDPTNGPDGITVRGQFELRRIADVDVLNNGWINEGDCNDG